MKMNFISHGIVLQAQNDFKRFSSIIIIVSIYIDSCAMRLRCIVLRPALIENAQNADD